jgi:glycosyltransferase involved in cell wall biosynthesis
MRIVHIVLALNVGGIECMLIDVCRKQALTAHVSLIVVNDSYDRGLLDCVMNDVRCVLIKRPPGSRNPWYPLRLLGTLFRLNPDIIHLHQLSLISLIRFLPLPRITTVHLTLCGPQPRVSAHEHICGISEAVGETIKRVYPRAVCAVVANGVDFTRFEARNRSPDGPFRLLQVSRLDHSVKGQDLLLHALAILRGRREKENLTVTFVGHGPSRGYLQALAGELGVERQCLYIGEKPRSWIYQNIGSYDLLVQPSRQEGFGLTIVEAMAARVPVLVSDLGAPMEVIQAGRFGYHFSCGNADDCADRIQQALSEIRTPSYAPRLNAAYEYAQSHFDVAQTVDRYFGEYKNVISTHESRSRRWARI